MQFFSLLLLGVGLSMDAFAVAVCKGLATPKASPKAALTVGLWFGGFQALMPCLGYFLGSRFHTYIENFDHWVAFVLLVIIGANMIKESFGQEEKETDASFGFKTMLLMAIATSIDALAVGIALAMDENTNIFAAVGIIGVTTFLLSASGLYVGNLFGAKYKGTAERTGGVILMLLGVKILLEHTGVFILPF
ncbi:MAG: manganese efflux pump MntP family protein [Clostridia bacterium]|nr:manganese efflux pump MntP family protein [Clostridia bacterium]